MLVDEVTANELGINLGDDVTVMGQPFEVSGFSTNGTNIVNTTVFIRSADFARIRGDGIAYVLAGAEAGVTPERVAGRLAAEVPGTTAQTRAEFARQESNVVRDMAADVMAIMTVIGFLIALAVVGLTLFTATLGKLREYGVVKALGADRALGCDRRRAGGLDGGPRAGPGRRRGARRRPSGGCAHPQRDRGDRARVGPAHRRWRLPRWWDRGIGPPPPGAARRPGHRLPEGLMTDDHTAVSVRQLTKTFGDGDLAVRAVRGVDLDIGAGEVILIMGPSGSGKTTLLLMLGAMLRPSSGSVLVDGIDLATAPERHLPALRARHLGFIFQDFNLLGALSAHENVELACNIAGTTGRPAHDHATELLVASAWTTASTSARTNSPAARATRRHSPSARQRPDRASGRRANSQPRLRARPRDRPTTAPPRRGRRPQRCNRQSRQPTQRGR